MGSQKWVEEVQTNNSTQILETEHLVPETSPEDTDEIIKKEDEGDEEGRLRLRGGWWCPRGRAES